MPRLRLWAAYILLRKWLEKSCGDDEKEAKGVWGLLL